jgi:hypothetical protein
MMQVDRLPSRTKHRVENGDLAHTLRPSSADTVGVLVSTTKTPAPVAHSPLPLWGGPFQCQRWGRGRQSNSFSEQAETVLVLSAGAVRPGVFSNAQRFERYGRTASKRNDTLDYNRASLGMCDRPSVPADRVELSPPIEVRKPATDANAVTTYFHSAKDPAHVTTSREPHQRN